MDDETNSGGNIATVKWSATDANGFEIERANKDPLLYTIEHQIESEDGTTDKYFDNVITENVYDQLYSKGHQTLVMSEIVDNRIDGSEVTKENGFTGNHWNIPKKTTKGWEVLIDCKDETTTWVDIKYVKEAIPIDLAEYVVENQIADNPEFACWVPYTLKKKDRIISKVKKKYWRITHKYGVRLPKNVTEAM